MDQKNKFEQLQDYLNNYVASSEDKHTALNDISHILFVLSSENHFERHLNDTTQ